MRHDNHHPPSPRLRRCRRSLPAATALAALLACPLAGSPPRCADRDGPATTDDAFILDGPRATGLAAALATAWLLEDSAAAPPAAWPLPRGAWRRAPATPTLAWLDRARPWRRGDAGPRPDGLLGLSTGDLSATVEPRLESASWRLDGPVAGRLDEAGNGLEAEALWAGRAAFWVHARDCGVGGDLELVNHPLWAEDERWLWRETRDGELTHDETRAGASLWGRLGRASTWQLALATEHLRWGVGPARSALLQGDAAPAVPHAQLRLESGRLSYLQLLGELASGEAGPAWVVPEFPHTRRLPREKWLAAHRLEWRERTWALGLGEAVVIGDRRPGPAYLVPTGVLWSQQHAQGDLDNTLLFADLRWRLPRVLPGAWMAWAELAVDDYTLGDWGRELEGQRTASALGLDGCPLPVWRRGEGGVGGMELASWRLPGLSWLGVQHTRARPYAGSHRFASSRWSHGEASLGPFPDPNTRATELRWRHEWSAARQATAAGLRWNPLLILTATRELSVHGANPPGRNVGGDLELSHRDGVDAALAPYLDGLREVSWETRLGAAAALRVATRGGRSLGCLELDLDWAARRTERAGASRADRAGAWRLRWSRPF